MSTSEGFTPEEVSEAKEFSGFFKDLLENHKESLYYYLADTALLDWFGHTIKGPKNIVSYLKNSAGTCKYCFPNVYPARKIGFRENHVIKVTSEARLYRKGALLSTTSEEVTPPNLTFSPVTQVQLTEKGQGDGPHNCESPESPRKKCKFDVVEGVDNVCTTELKYITSEGHVEFHRKSSKKLQKETKWNRRCKLEVAYSASNFEDCIIYMIIYQGTVKCRRNLLKDFESCEPDD